MTPLIVAPFAVPQGGGVIRRFSSTVQWACALAAGWLACSWDTHAATSPYRGLWVGQITLSHVNEVSIPLDENNVAIAPDPKVPTPTADQAHLLLILHVNGAGQVNLLKDCAILGRSGPLGPDGSAAGVVELKKKPGVLSYPGALLKRESDYALVTDERLYGLFPPQPALRIASVAFDFGDGKATDAVEAVLQSVVETTAQSVAGSSQDFRSATGQQTARTTALGLGIAAGNAVIQRADAAEAFRGFREAFLSPAKVTAIATAANPTSAGEYTAALAAATALKTNSFYADGRGLGMLQAIVAAVSTATTAEAKTEAAQRAAAAFADLANDYQRFLAGKGFGDMIAGGSDAAATAASAVGATLASIRNAVNAETNVAAARSTALTLDANNPYSDRRAAAAVDVVVSNMVAKAASYIGGDPEAPEFLRAETEKAGQNALDSAVDRYAVPAVPTSDYSSFIASDAYRKSAAVTADAAVKAMVLERSLNVLADLTLLRRIGMDAAIDALRQVGQDALGSAGRVRQTEVPLAGQFGPGVGDPRLTFEIHRLAQAALGNPGLTGTLHLAANHVTNPFLHRRHQEHRIGLDITRAVRIDFDGQVTDPLAKPGYGVDRITGTYREEIKGLHKPLGPAGEDIGLKVEGRFELNRVSLNDALNAR
ncbi:MAG: hypothetical protein IT581_23660 [Verrucomicrobiales bacterium]|nr:hypothetical protein [Verrucomicrobiales bacterium]